MGKQKKLEEEYEKQQKDVERIKQQTEFLEKRLAIAERRSDMNKPTPSTTPVPVPIPSGGGDKKPAKAPEGEVNVEG